ncbi:MAG TPA: alpha/beta hydrolase [Lacipirellulaceae bacterium]
MIRSSRIGAGIFVLLCAAANVGYAAETASQPNAAPAATAQPWTDKYWTHPDGTRFHYIEMGQGPAVILIHGYLGTAASNWFRNDIGPRLAKTNRVIGIDMRNHGLTTPNPAPKGSMARDVLALMDALGIQRAHIGGYSMGGFLTSQLMALAPERFITAHFGGSGVTETEEFRSMIPPDTTGTPDLERQAMERFTANRAATPAGERVGNGADRAPNAAPAPLPSLSDLTGTPADMPALDLTKIEFPVLHVIGEYDNPNRMGHRLWRELKNYQRVVLPGRGHISAIAPNFIHPAYPDAMTRFITTHNPK